MALRAEVSQNYLQLLKTKGEEGLYRYIVGNGVMRSIKVRNPEIEILNLSESFFSLFRSTGNEDFFVIGRALRRAANKLYRQFLRINKEKEVNLRFLNVVR